MPKFNLGWLKDKNGEKFAPKTFIKQIISKTGENLEEILDNKIDSPPSAKVGQQLIVKNVDKNGKPIDWECVDIENVQADYAQTDSTSPDYIKNKPTNLVVKTDLDSYVKTTQYATSSQAGLVRTSTSYGTTMNGQYIQIYPAGTSDISSKSNSSNPLTSNNIDYIVKSGLGNSKLTWTEAEKTKARSVIGALGASDIDLSTNNISHGDKNTSLSDVIDMAKESISNHEKRYSSTYFTLTDTVNEYEYIVQMQNGNLVSFCKTAEIRVDKLPDKISYFEDETFDTTGMVINAVSQDGTIKEITNYEYSDIVNGIVTITYQEYGTQYNATVNVNVLTMEDILIDFEYIANDDGTYTITGWKQTLNGEPSTEMIVPDSSLIRM